ncbi:hypothetical protein C8A01DRAFT_32435 [Parachaetomium inaequale]|uniref:Myb-like domain-containing protein n=1 Tax=Parachaetomium inaequale TaxID=2588326 RepID=A0AAN6SVC9_9PEZI|nr:hypothetical protein C8A01DRAFT_32435 [Parachaetomium inaequale]
MLNKKSAFKPKAAIRRPAAGTGSQSASRPSTIERSSNNTPAPQESSSSKPQPAPHPAPSVPQGNPPTSGGGAAKDAGTPLQEQNRPVAPDAVEPAPQASTTSAPPAIVPEGTDETPAAPASKATQRELAAAQSEKPVTQSAPTVREPASSKTPVLNTVSTSAEASTDARSTAVTGTAAATTSTDSTVFSLETPSTTQTPSTAPTTAPATAATQITVPDSQAAAPESQQGQTAAAPAETPASEQVQPTTEATFEPAPGPSQPAKRKRGQKRTTATAPGEDAAEQSQAAPPKKRLRKRAAPLPGEEGYQPAARRATRSRKRSGSAAENGEAEEDGDENTGQPKKRPPRPQREATPPDAETVEIDITQVKMADLAKDMHIGKKFSLHDELMERERAKRLRYNERRKRQQTGEEGDDTAADGETPGVPPSSNPNTSTQPTPAATDDAAAEPPADSSTRAPIGETYQIIDGEIVLDHRSLQVDRHARAREEAGELVEIEENDFTHHTTSATYLRRNLKPQQWTDDETDLFYQALQAFGTDFDTICRMFKSKTRKHIKLKFNREERVNPARITAALVGEKNVSIDMEQYQRATGQEYETAEAIYAEQKKAEEEFEARQKALEDEKAEEVRRKKEEVLAQLNSAVDGEGSSKKGGKRGRKKKGPAVMGL